MEYFNYMRSGKKLLVIVDPSFESLFKRIRQHNLNSSVALKADTIQHLVFILGSFDKVSSYSANYEAKTEVLPLANVAGMLPGKTKPDEYVIFSGHYDHLGIVPAIEGDSIANGADDDASGTTAVITLAKYFKKLNKNARTLIFVTFTAEELGGFGSQYFSKQVDPDKTVAMFNIEM
ncbi:MAG: M20/M25/M40 family metallo-hydrolase, partial [Sphingobacteriaceae bacterium]